MQNTPEENRLNHLKKRLAKNAKGKALLDFASGANISISFDASLPDGIYGKTDDRKTGVFNVYLNPRAGNDILVSMLYHELRHAKQQAEGLLLHSGTENNQPVEWPVKNPAAFFVINKIAEADAFARQVELSFETDARTKRAMSRHCSPVFNAYNTAHKQNRGGRENALLMAFAAFTKHSSEIYDQTCLKELTERIERYEAFKKNQPELAAVFFDTPEKFPLTTGIIREFTKLEDGKNYLSAVPDAALASLGQVSPEIQEKLAALEERYAAFFNELRLEKIAAELEKSDSGRRLDSFAQNMDVTAAFDPDMPENLVGIYNNNGFVLLNPKADDAILLATLAHELHHAGQEEKGLKLQCFKEKNGAREIYAVHDPVTYFYLTRLQEADAFSFQMEFSRDHALATGDTKPAAFLKKLHPEVFDAYVEAIGKDGKDRVLARHNAFCAFIKKSACYDADTLAGLKNMMDNCKKMRASGSEDLRAFLQEKRDIPLTAHTIKKFGEMAEGTNFLADRPDHELLSEKYLGKIDPAVKAELDALAVEFKSFFGGLSNKPQATKPQATKGMPKP